MSTTTDASWIQPGAEVIVYNDSHLNPTARRDRIAKVAMRSFTTESGDRYRLDNAKGRIGGTWGYTEYVVPAASETGRAELAKQTARNRVNRARSAVVKWQGDRTRENRLAAIAALQAVED